LKPLTKADMICMAGIAVIVIAAISKRVLDTQLFWYPF
ncbi:energy-coupling factor transporter transmembrane protein EcfT, partial [Vibrio parahaemolyticus]